MKKPSSTYLRSVCIGVTVALVSTLGFQGSANATEPVDDSAAAISEAVDTTGQAPAGENQAVTLPTVAEESATAEIGDHILSLDIPASGDSIGAVDNGEIFDGTDVDTEVAVQTTAYGLRALVHIESEDAPERFEFPVGGDAASLKKASDGSVDVFDSEGTIIATAQKPWAVDASGREVPTHYEIDGTTLVQVVNHQGAGFEYGIVADPDFIWVLRCTAAVGLFIAKNGHIAVKVARVIGNATKFIKKLNTYKKAGKSRKATLKLIAWELAGAKDLDDLIMKCWP